MTNLFVNGFSGGRTHFITYRTNDNFPHISDWNGNKETPFHIMRTGEKKHESETLERVLYILKHALSDLDFPFETDAPEIEDHAYIRSGGEIKVSIIDIDAEHFIVSTIVRPIVDEVLSET